jgi:hypothetical protein
LIETFAKDQDYGTPTKYDITISKNSQRKPVTFIPKVGQKKPLSAAEQKAVDEKVDLDYLEKLASPKTPAQIYKAMSYIRPNLDQLFMSLGLQRPAEVQGEPEIKAEEQPVEHKKAKPSVAGNPKVKVVEEESSSNDDEDFPDAG